MRKIVCVLTFIVMFSVSPIAKANYSFVWSFPALLPRQIIDVQLVKYRETHNALSFILFYLKPNYRVGLELQAFNVYNKETKLMSAWCPFRLNLDFLSKKYKMSFENLNFKVQYGFGYSYGEGNSKLGNQLFLLFTYKDIPIEFGIRNYRILDNPIFETYMRLGKKFHL